MVTHEPTKEAREAQALLREWMAGDQDAGFVAGLTCAAELCERMATDLEKGEARYDPSGRGERALVSAAGRIRDIIMRVK